MKSKPNTIERVTELFKVGHITLEEAVGMYFNLSKQIAIIWSVDDVQLLRSDLTDDQAFDVLSHVKNYHDAEIGVNWDSLSFWIDELYPIESEG